mmetsp:Transcript_6731/g.13887  ORF Transcript_6731/g.13887 Transcript_6731/m.13887 type:complete len:207 (-) Transcript_6731:790-1410(-)
MTSTISILEYVGPSSALISSFTSPDSKNTLVSSWNSFFVLASVDKRLSTCWFKSVLIRSTICLELSLVIRNCSRMDVWCTSCGRSAELVLPLFHLPGENSDWRGSSLADVLMEPSRSGAEAVSPSSFSSTLGALPDAPLFGSSSSISSLLLVSPTSSTLSRLWPPTNDEVGGPELAGLLAPLWRYLLNEAPDGERKPGLGKEKLFW